MRSRSLLLPLLLIHVTNGLCQTIYPNVLPNITYISPSAAAQLLGGANVSVSNATFSGSGLQLARFTDGNQGLGISEGVVITTGDAAFASLSGTGNIGDDMSVVAGSPSGTDPDLELLNGSASVFHVGILEFDFVSTGTDVNLEYVFGSEEYLSWVFSGFNDAFGFFLSGPGINGPYSNGAINLALVGSDPVSVNTVNPLINSFAFFDNEYIPHIGVPTIEGVNAQTAFDGYAYGLDARLTIQCNQLYHIKIAICNSGDDNLDSGVFLKKGTITSPYSPPGPLTVAPSPQCEGQPLTLNVVGDPSWMYTWSTGQSGVGLQQITTQAVLGVNSYSVTAEYLPGCTLTGSSLAGDVVVHSSNNIPPSCLGINGSGNYQAYVQAGDQLCFQIPTSDTPGEIVYLNWDAGAPGSFLSSAAPQAIGTYCWTPTLSDIGTYSFVTTAQDDNACGSARNTCTFDIKVVCDFCPISVFYENRSPGGLPLPALTEAGWRIVAGESVDAGQTDGPVLTGLAAVEFRAPEILLEPGFLGGVNFLAISDPSTCLEDCDECCDDWQGFTVDTYDADGDGEYDDLINVFSPNGDGVNDYWMVLDQDHPFCAYGAQAFELTIWSPGSSPVWYLQSSPDGCCPFESKAPNNPIPHSSIYWDGTVNTGFLSCNGCPAPTGTYYYVLHLWGCNGSVTYTGYFEMLRTMVPASTNGQAMDVITEATESSRARQSTENVLHQLPEISLYPNPSSDVVTLAADEEILDVYVEDIVGQQVAAYSGVRGPTLQASVASWAKGEYIFTIRRSSGRVDRLRFVKT